MPADTSMAQMKTVAPAHGRFGPVHGTGYDVLQHDISSRQEIEALWSRFTQKPVATPFQNPDYLGCLLDTFYKETGDTLVIFEFRHYPSGRTEMLVPLRLAQIGTVRWITAPHPTLSDQFAPVFSAWTDVARTPARELLSNLIENLPAADALHIENLPERIGQYPNPLLDADSSEEQEPVLTLDLVTPDVTDEWRRKSVYKEARTKYRKLEKAGAEFSEVVDGQEKKRIFDMIRTSSMARQAALGRRDALSCSVATGFCALLTETPSGRSPARLFAVKKDDEIIAASMAYVDEVSFHGSLIGLGEEKWRKLSPGIVMICKAIDWAQENGLESFSFGRGLQDYKSRFGAGPRPVRRVRVPLSYSGRYYLMIQRLRELGKQSLHRLMADIQN